MKEISYQLTLEITNHIDQFVGEPLFIAGNFNGWRPDDYSPGLVPAAGRKEQYVLKDLQQSSVEFRISRGSWSTLTAGINGTLEPPVAVDPGKDTSVSVEIRAWRDMFPASTASPQVHVMDEAFFLPESGLYKKIWLYLPADYHTGNRPYPVLYMHDGQHLFDEATSTGRTGPVEWMVDETVDASPYDAIVVAVASAANANERKQEYLLNPDEVYQQPRGRAYLSDIVSVLKPFVDTHYRTLPDVAHTAMAGSSLGGLLTLYAGLLYPEVFGSLGVLSPSIWMDDRPKLFKALADRLQKQGNIQNFYLYGGKLENRGGPEARETGMTENILLFSSRLANDHRFEVKTEINPVGRHGALYWQKAFPAFYEWWQQTLI